MHLSPYSLLLLGTCLAVTTTVGCRTDTLDGGSNGSADASSGPDATEGRAEGPVAGQITGKPFAPASIQLRYSNSDREWFFSMSNYATNCGVISSSSKNAIPPADQMVVSVSSIEPAAATTVISYGDLHAATFQLGVFEVDAGEPYAEPAKEGVLELDSWSEDEGATVTGYIDLSNDESSVKGTFTATVCQRR